MTHTNQLEENERLAKRIASFVQTINLHTNTLELDYVEQEIYEKAKDYLDKKDVELLTCQLSFTAEIKNKVEELKKMNKVSGSSSEEIWVESGYMEACNDLLEELTTLESEGKL